MIRRPTKVSGLSIRILKTLSISVRIGLKSVQFEEAIKPLSTKIVRRMTGAVVVL